jgi:hypothetical protein
MIVGGMLVGASGNVNPASTFVAGKFNDNQFGNYGENLFGMYSLKTTPAFPKTFYCIFALVETDQDDEDAVEDLTGALSLAAITIGAAFGGVGATVGVIAAAVFDFIGDLVGAFIDDDVFPPYGVRLVLENINQFGGYDSENKRTENIRGHGGTYRVGYKWHLA